MVKKIVLIIIVILASTYVQAATYYVRKDGHDTNCNGTADANSSSAPNCAWLTINKCNTLLSGTNTCMVGNGTYTEDLNITSSGTDASNLLTFIAQNNRQAIISGHIIITSSGHYVKIEGFKVILPNAYQDGIHSSGNYNQLISNYVTTNSTTLGQSNTAFGLHGTYGLADGNYVEKTCHGYNLTGTNHTFQNNEATLLRHPAGVDCGDTDYMRFFGSNHVIKNNYFHGINWDDIDGDDHVDCFQTFDTNGIQDIISNITLDGNYCDTAHQGIMANSDYGSDGFLIRNNIFTNVVSWGICVEGITNVRVYNNTVDATGGIHGMGCRDGGSCEVKNNIFYGGSLYWFDTGATMIDGTTESPGKNNLLYLPGETITGYSGDTINQDPLFINRGTNYHLQIGSPARTGGLTISGWATPLDKDGKSRPQGASFSRGAYEYYETGNIRGITASGVTIR